MWPPSSEDSLLALSTMARAFQRMARSNAVLDSSIAGMGLLPLHEYCVDVGCRRRVRDRSALPVGSVNHLLKEEVGSVGAIDLQDTIQRVEPFSGLDRIKVATAVHRHLPWRLPSDAGALIT